VTGATQAPCVVVVGAAARDITPDDPRGWRLGGGVTYSAMTSARLGVPTAALIGVDALASTASEIDELRAAGCSVVTVPLRRGPVFENVEAPGGRIQTAIEVAEALPVSSFPAPWRDAPGWILAPVSSELPPEWATLPPQESIVAFGWQGILRRLERGRRVVPLAPGPSELLRRADIVGVSRHDLLHDVSFDALRGWLGAPSELLLTSGDLGGLIVELASDRTSRTIRYPAVPDRVAVDPTGCGDVMLAALLATRVALGADPGRMGSQMLLAAAAASLNTEGPGLAGVPTLGGIRGRLGQLGLLPD
jgi:sugar/nucleoside kinase (ribokinase family)